MVVMEECMSGDKHSLCLLSQSETSRRHVAASSVYTVTPCPKTGHLWIESVLNQGRHGAFYLREMAT